MTEQEKPRERGKTSFSFRREERDAVIVDIRADVCRGEEAVGAASATIQAPIDADDDAEAAAVEEATGAQVAAPAESAEPAESREAASGSKPAVARERVVHLHLMRTSTEAPDEQGEEESAQVERHHISTRRGSS